MNPCTSQTATFIMIVSERQKEKKNGRQRRLLLASSEKKWNLGNELQIVLGFLK